MSTLLLNSSRWVPLSNDHLDALNHVYEQVHGEADRAQVDDNSTLSDGHVMCFSLSGRPFFLLDNKITRVKDNIHVDEKEFLDWMRDDHIDKQCHNARQISG